MCTSAYSPGINRNIVECKDLWIRERDSFSFVLIETLWNVKELTVSMVNPSFRINRNIVKCKDAT